ncbi:hypothetical protein [Pedosphaera parvula]|uniref:hypothetical protein n=1 Tax=Pedosphaera parvula TaxID=1032527 RepID=UPI00058FADC2|nr:hypothetical protein [Pedosphaera parvula]
MAGLLILSPEARANVYATNIKLNNGTTNIVAASGASVNISYILNEPATAGTTVQVLSGTSVVRTFTIASGNAGTLKGVNNISWDGKDNTSQNAPGGTFSVSITPAAIGYTNWTQISSDTNAGNYVNTPTGIAVDKNPTSPYYGRVFVGNSQTGPNAATNPGDVVGIQKLNADGSPAEEGQFTTGGHGWSGGFYSPWKIEVSDDDFVYINDWAGDGEIYRWDPTLSASSLLYVLRNDNWGNDGNVNMSGPAIYGSGTNTEIWMADTSSFGSLGILKYTVGLDGTCLTNDPGVSVVGLGDDLSLNPYDVAVDKAHNIYTVQYQPDIDAPATRVLRFPAYNPSTNNGIAETKADWAIGNNDNTMASANGIAVDPTGKYVAVAFRGTTTGPRTNANTRVFYATNGTEVAKIDTGSDHEHTDVAWDAVGNLYDLDNTASLWRAYSPPGANQATTKALNFIQVTGPPHLTGISISGGNAVINFTDTVSDSATAFTLQSAAAVTGPFADVIGASIVRQGTGLFQATTPVSGAIEFYRIKR